MRYPNTLEQEYSFPDGVELKVADNKTKRVILREVIGYDEETISLPKYREKPAHMIIELISRCIAEIPGTEQFPTKKELKDLPIGVLDDMLIEIRRLTQGEEIEVTALCPDKACRKPYETVVTLDEIPYRDGKFAPKKVKLERGVVSEGGKKLMSVTIRPPDGHMQEEFSERKDLEQFGMLSTDMIHACTVDVDGVKPDKAMISSMAKVDRKKISVAIQEFPGPDTAIKVTCPACGRVYDYRLNPLDFLA